MTLTTVNAGMLDTQAQYNGFKNRIINGAMVNDQRNAGASGTASTYTVDRWGYFGSQASKGTWQQSAGAVTPPSGFINYLGFTSSSAYSVLTTDQFYLYQRIEGLNTADLSFGSASAAYVTLSFWVRSSLTGTFGGFLTNSASNRTYPFSYTISVANTWEQKTVSVAGDTTGTWLTTSGIGIGVGFNLGTGATYSATANAWTASAFVTAPTGATSVVGTNGATFYITGVQLEKGSTATSFDYRPIGTELALCQRYCETIVSAGNNAWLWAAALGSTTNGRGGAAFRVTKRAIPTTTFAAANQYLIQEAGGNRTPSAIAAIAAQTNGVLIDATVSGASSGYGAVCLENAVAGSIMILIVSEL